MSPLTTANIRLVSSPMVHSDEHKVRLVWLWTDVHENDPVRHVESGKDDRKRRARVAVDGTRQIDVRVDLGVLDGLRRERSTGVGRALTGMRRRGGLTCWGQRLQSAVDLLAARTQSDRAVETNILHTRVHTSRPDVQNSSHVLSLTLFIRMSL